MKITFVLAAVAALSIGTSAAHADVLYSSLATSVDPYNTGHSWTIAGSDNFYNAYADSFTMNTSFTVESVSVILANDTPDTFEVGLYDTNSSGNAGTLLAGLFSAVTPDNDTSPHLYTFTLTTPLNLSAGTYWVGVLPGSNTLDASWLQNPDTAGTTDYSPDGTTWQDSGFGATSYSGEFVVNGTAVPEPASLGIAAIGSLALIARRRKLA